MIGGLARTLNDLVLAQPIDLIMDRGPKQAVSKASDLSDTSQIQPIYGWARGRSACWESVWHSSGDRRDKV